ncbi:MAG: response regulator [Planctomycetota bacterium]
MKPTSTTTDTADRGAVSLILVVDDNEANLYTMGRILRRAGFGVLEARTAAEALLKARTRPDLIVLDVNLPDRSGFEVCQDIRRDPDTRSICVLHVSASYVQARDRVHGLDLGADGYLVHPIDPKELVATTSALIRARRAESRIGPAPATASEDDRAATPVIPWVASAVARLAGEAGLTRSESFVVEHAVRGLGNKEIGAFLGTSASTVRTQLIAATKKLHVSSRGELAYLVFCESHRLRACSPGFARLPTV